MLALTKDADDAARGNAAWGLKDLATRGQLGRELASARQALLSLTEDSHPGVQANAAEGLGALGARGDLEEDHEAAEQRLAALSAVDQTRQSAVWSLAQLSATTTE